MRRIFGIICFFTLIFSSCEIINPAEDIPSYIKINPFTLTTKATEGSNTHNIVDAWVYIDDQSIGCFELPALIPVLKSGDHKIDIRPGIKVDGISDKRALYPYYNPYIISSKLYPDSTIVINPTTTYIESTNFLFVDPFDQSGIFFEKTANSDTNINIIYDTANFFNDKSYAACYVNEAKPILDCATSLTYELNKLGQTAFLEIDCKSNIPFKVGLIIYNPNETIQHPIVVVTPSTEWKKLYINLTEVAQRERNAISYKVFFRAEWNSSYGVDNGYIYIDNVKLIN